MSAMNHFNRRETPRLEIQLGCQVMAPQAWVFGAMQTVNISRGGLLIAWRADRTEAPLPAVGQMLTVEIELPASHDFGRKCMHCEGSVARVDHFGGKAAPNVALRVNYMDFRSLRAPISTSDRFRCQAGSRTA